MSGYDIFKRAVIRLGFSDYENRLSSRAIEFINQICIDLKINTVERLSQEIEISDELCEALCCGVAMLLSFSEGDSEKNKLYCDLYNSKRASVLSKVCFVEDTLPKMSGGF